MALSSVMVTCLALSTAVATCCWCSCERNGRIWAIMAFNLFAISVWKQKGERSLLKGRPTVFNGGWSANRALLNWTEREDNDCPFPSHSSLLLLFFSTFCIPRESGYQSSTRDTSPPPLPPLLRGSWSWQRALLNSSFIESRGFLDWSFSSNRRPVRAWFISRFTRQSSDTRIGNWLLLSLVRVTACIQGEYIRGMGRGGEGMGWGIKYRFWKFLFRRTRTRNGTIRDSL